MSEDNKVFTQTQVTKHMFYYRYPTPVVPKHHFRDPRMAVCAGEFMGN